MKKAMKVLSSITTTLLFLILILMVFVVISSKASGGEPNFLGYQLKPVLSGSMEPTFMTGSIIAIKPVEDPTTLKKDDVITFTESKDKLVTHRIIEVIKTGENTMYRTQGDNNKEPDTNPVLAENVIGVYSDFTIPYAGYLNNFIQSKNGVLFLLVLPGVLLIGYSAISIIRALKELEKPKTANEIEVSESN